MKGQVEQIITRQDNVIKFAVTFQPEVVPDNVIKWRFQDVEVLLSDADMVSIPRAEYEALRAGGSWVIPDEKRQALKTIAATLLTWCGE